MEIFGLSSIKSRLRHSLLQLFLGIVLISIQGCSPGQTGLRLVADALGGGSAASFASEDDVELIWESLPFALKSMESLHEKLPGHKGLCLSLAQGYMLYAYGKLETEAANLKNDNYAEYKKLRVRIAKFYRRAYDYGVSGLNGVHSDFEEKYKENHQKAISLVNDKEDVSLLYWTGAALAKWISFSKSNPVAIVQLPAVPAFMEKALELDSNYDYGAIHEFLVNYERFVTGDSVKAMQHYRQALDAARGRKTSIYLTYVEAFAIPGHDEQAFDIYLQKILAFKLDNVAEYRLANAITRQKAELLLSQKRDFFLGDENED